jgi:membrane protease subunit HflK
MLVGHLWSMVRHLVSSRRDFAVLILLIAIGWASSGLYRVEDGAQAIVLRFGAPVATTGPGWHFHWPAPIERVRFEGGTAIGLRSGAPARAARA